MGNQTTAPKVITRKDEPNDTFNIDARGNLMQTMATGQKENLGKVQGTTIVPGHGQPQSTDGIKGDYYLDLDEVVLYGPKPNGSWNLSDAVPLIGASGSSGVGVQSAVIDETGHLILTLTDGSTKDAGNVVGSQGVAGNDGRDGVDGRNGVDGLPGQTDAAGKDAVQPTFSIGNVSEGPAAVTLTGTQIAPVLNFVLQKGNAGQNGISPTVQIGTITTVPAGGQGSATITGNFPNYVLNLALVVGNTGSAGPTGATPVISIGNVTAGSTPAVSIRGTTANPILDFVLATGNTGATGPAGANGQSPTISIGQVTTLAAGQGATASLTGTFPNYVLNLGLPQAVNAIRTKRVAIPNIASLAITSIIVLWDTPFADANYTIPMPNISTATAGIAGVLGGLSLQGTRNKTKDGCIIDIKNVALTLFSTANVYLEIMAIHD